MAEAETRVEEKSNEQTNVRRGRLERDDDRSKATEQRRQTHWGRQESETGGEAQKSVPETTKG